jgi:maleylacetate reductase
MTLAFSYDPLPMRVVFAAGSLGRLAEEVDRLGVRRVLLLCSTRQAEGLQGVYESLGERSAGVYSGAQMHVPVASVRAARSQAERRGADGIVAIGGGSTIGLSKALALETDLRIIAVPTTYSGSEMTPIWGITENGEKRTGRDRRVLPASVLYDPDLTMSMPAELRVVSGVNAIAHAVEGLYAPDGSRLVSLMAEEGVRALVESIEHLSTASTATAAAEALYGSWLCGVVLGATTMSLHHKICHVLGGTFDLPHSAVHSIVLPYVLAFNEGHSPSAVASLRRATGSSEPAEYIRDLSVRLGAPSNLVEIGFRPDGIERVVRAVISSPYANPRPVTAEGVGAILRSATDGASLDDVR